MNKETLKYILASALERPPSRVTARDLRPPLDSGKPVVLLGIRRCGKTFILYETMQRLVAKGVDPRCLIHLNFEDDRLLPIRADELDLILRAHAELHPDVAGRRRYLFLDEVQNAPGWEPYVRRLQDTENIRIFLTGSSSCLLQRNIASAMRGRSVSFEVFPLSFSEYLRFRNIEWKRYSPASEARVSAALDDFLQTGGFPEVVLAHPALRLKILKEYMDLIIYKDLLERYSLDNPHLARLMLRQFLSHPASFLTVHKLHKDLSSQGIRVSKNTLYEYLDHMVESYIIFSVPKHSRSVRKQAVNPRKVYTVDAALSRVFAPDAMLDRGRKLENAVYLHFRRREEEVFYDANSAEVDFVIGLTRPSLIVNVAYSLNDPATLKREVESLRWAKSKHPTGGPLLIAHELPSRLRITNIRTEPAWQFLLG